MKVKVRLFAMHRELAGARDLEFDITEGGTVESVWSACVAAYPRLGEQKEAAVFAVNGRYAAAGQIVQSGDEVAIIPPVSGG